MNLDRFIKAQELDYNIAQMEISEGHKRSHWMWYIFPQLKGLGESLTADYYGIEDLNEAMEYLNNEYLYNNLINICKTLLVLESNDAESVFGYPDNLKLQSCMTLFSLANPKEQIFMEVLNKFYNGELDVNTLELLRNKE